MQPQANKYAANISFDEKLLPREIQNAYEGRHKLLIITHYLVINFRKHVAF